jgi:hypothetical protein
MPIPSFEQLLQPTLDALRQADDVTTIKAIDHQVIHSLGLAPEDVAQPHGDTTQTELEYRLAWARTYLKHYGLIDNPKRGAWTLTAQGRTTKQVDPKTVSVFVKDLVKRGKVDADAPIEESDDPTSQDVTDVPAQSRRLSDIARPTYFQPDPGHHPLAAVSTSPFQPRTFELLEGIHTTPTKDYYQAHKEEFKQFIEEPFQRVFRQVAERLPVQIRAIMETENHIFARFLKYDWGKGGTWEFYWGAFYPKGGKRTEDAQLSM